jgi:hypothetical protein
MADSNQRKRHHFILEGFTEREEFKQLRRKIERKKIPQQDRQRHGRALLRQINALKSELSAAREVQEEAGLEGGFGLRVEFEGFPEVDLAFESLARDCSGIELLNVRQEGEVTYATVFVPDGKLAHFENLIREYLEEKRDRIGRLRDHGKLINAIR